MIYLAFIALGGALGALARFSLNSLMVRLLGDQMPYGTFAVNVVGSFLMGLVAAFLLARMGADGTLGPRALEVQAFVATGLLGSFTTFSTFSLDTVKLLETGRFTDAALYIAGSVLLGVVALMAGLFLGRMVTG